MRTPEASQRTDRHLEGEQRSTSSSRQLRLLQQARSNGGDGVIRGTRTNVCRANKDGCLSAWWRTRAASQG